MIEIGGKPIIWHILKIYAAHGINEFIICVGYKGYILKEYFANYFLHTSDVTFDLRANRMEVHERHTEPWKITLVDTGEYTQTGGRLKRVSQYLKDEEVFCFTYGDGVSDIDIGASIAFHRQHGRLATVTATIPPARFGTLEIAGTQVTRFNEKPQGSEGMINGGFFVLSPKVIDLIEDDSSAWEGKPLEILTKDGELAVWPHRGFWQPMDTMRDKSLLEDLWQSGKAPWKIW